MLRKSLTLVPVCALLVLAGTEMSAWGQQPVRHPRLAAALYELSTARKELADAGGGFGGHRKKALQAIDEAMESLRFILEVKGDDPRVGLRKPEFYRKFKDYPHLRQVIVDLREAREELRDAKADFRGRKERALREIDVAIEQVKLCTDSLR